MSTGLLIITHNKIGEALLITATKMLEACPLENRTLEINTDSNPDELTIKAVTGGNDGIARCIPRPT